VIISSTVVGRPNNKL